MPLVQWIPLAPRQVTPLDMLLRLTDQRVRAPFQKLEKDLHGLFGSEVPDSDVPLPDVGGVPDVGVELGGAELRNKVYLGRSGQETLLLCLTEWPDVEELRRPLLEVAFLSGR